jgi:hypothetical protein
MPSSINRIPAGAEMLMATAVGCVLCHIWQMKAVSGTSLTILRPWLWLRLGLAPDVFSDGVPHVPTEKFRDYAVILLHWPWLEAGVINHNPCSLSLTVASETVCLLNELRLCFLVFGAKHKA